MVDFRALRRLDWRIILIVNCLMFISLLVISSMTAGEGESVSFWTPLAKSQLRWYCLGWCFFLFCVAFDYRRLREWALPLYIVMIVLLVGLFFVSPIQNVHRWYRIGGLMSFQPSEEAKLILIVALSWFLERRGNAVSTLKTAFQIGGVVGIPFLLILKQPDLGTALILYPMALGMTYFAGVHRLALKLLSGLGLVGLVVSSLFFLKVVSHEEMRPMFTRVLREYQYERLNPDTYHQKASLIAIALGGWTGSGWRESTFSGKKWLPAAQTDSVFSAFGEEFGFVGLMFLLFLFFSLIYCSFQVATLAKDPFGRLLAAGLSMYLGLHAVANMAMMCALLPISGVPLIFVTYGGSSLMASMGALGVLQSIYSRRFMF